LAKRERDKAKTTRLRSVLLALVPAVVAVVVVVDLVGAVSAFG
jgi:hypothetical protein